MWFLLVKNSLEIDHTAQGGEGSRARECACVGWTPLPAPEARVGKQGQEPSPQAPRPFLQSHPGP